MTRRSNPSASPKPLSAMGEADLRALADYSPIGIWQLDNNGETVYANPATCALLGVGSPQDLVGRNFREFVDAENIALIEAQLALRRQGKSTTYETELMSARGDKRTVIIAGTPVTGPDGELIGTIGNLIDITERKRAEVALRESQRQSAILTAVTEQSSAAIVVTDINGDIEYVNPAFSQITGYSSEEAIGQNPRILKSGTTTKEEYAELWATITAGRAWHGEFLNVKKDGTTFWERARIFPIRDEQGQIAHFVAIKEDISKLRQAQEAELAQRTLAEALVDTVMRLSYSSDARSMAESILDSLARVFEYDLAGLVLIKGETREVTSIRGPGGTGVEEWLASLATPPPKAIDIADRARRAAVAAQKAVTDLQLRAGAPESLRDLQSYIGAPIHLNANLIGYIHVFSRKPDAFNVEDSQHLGAFANQLAAALQNMRLYQELETYSGILEDAVETRTRELTIVKDRAEAILNNSPDMIVLLYEDGTIQAINPAFAGLVGAEIETLYRKPATDALAITPKERLQEALKAALERQESRRFEAIFRAPNGGESDMDIIVAPLQTSRGMTGAICSLRDISALKVVDRLKDEFVANVSHELRTPITGMKLNYRLLEMDDANRAKYMRRLGREIDRLNILIEDLLRLSRLDQGRTPLQLSMVDMRGVAEEVAEDRAAMADEKGVALTVKDQSKPAMARADNRLIGQALSVLLTNAINYTPTGGAIEVEAVTRDHDGRAWSGIRVTDSGPGIDPEDAPKLFTRFFRGKAGRDTQVPGTGLGLSIAKEIIDLHHGEIEAVGSSEQRGGAQFTLWLPVADSN